MIMREKDHQSSAPRNHFLKIAAYLKSQRRDLDS